MHKRGNGGPRTRNRTATKSHPTTNHTKPTPSRRKKKLVTKTNQTTIPTLTARTSSTLAAPLRVTEPDRLACDTTDMLITTAISSHHDSNSRRRHHLTQKRPKLKVRSPAQLPTMTHTHPTQSLAPFNQIATVMGYPNHPTPFITNNNNNNGINHINNPYTSLRHLPLHPLLLAHKSIQKKFVNTQGLGATRPSLATVTTTTATNHRAATPITPQVEISRIPENHHTYSPQHAKKRISHRLHAELSTTMPIFKQQMAQFTTQLVQQYSPSNPIPTPAQYINSDGSVNTQIVPTQSRHLSKTRQRTHRRHHSRRKSLTSTTPRRNHSTTTPNNNDSSQQHQQQQQHQHQHHPHNNDQRHQHYQPRKTAFQRLLPHINRLSQTLTPRIRKLASYVKSGTITLTGPMIDLISTHIVPPVSNALGKVGDRGENLLLWVDKQIAKRKDIPVDQISAIRTQVIAIAANSIVAVSKAVAAYFSNSGVMLAEALHSLADLSNQCLLLFGTTKALRDSDDIHPYGYATAKYIYGVLSASGVFFISCALTMYHAITQYLDDTHAVDVTWLTAVVLGVSFIVEGYSQYAAYKSIKELAAKDEMTFMEYIRGGRETTSIAIFVEDSIAILGLLIAITTTTLTHIYQNNIYDTIGTGCIGLAMGFVAFFLFHRNESYVLGTSFSTEEKGEILEALKSRPAVTAVHDLKAVAYGESDCRVKAEVVFNGKIIAKQVLDQNKLIPITLPFKESSSDTAATGAQSMLIGPDGTLAGQQILYHLTKNAGLSSDDATQLLLRFGGECVTEVARETDQVEKHTKALFPEVTHLDLECHASNPLEDFSSEHFLYPYLAKHRKATEMVASAKRAKKSRAWSIAAKTNFQSLQQAMRGEHDLFIPPTPHSPLSQANLQSQQHPRGFTPPTSSPQQQQQQQQQQSSSIKYTSTLQDPGSVPPHHLHSLQTPLTSHQPSMVQSQQHPSQLNHQHRHLPPQQQQHHQHHQQHQPSQQQMDQFINEITRDINLQDHTLPTAQVFYDVASLTQNTSNTSKASAIRLGRYDKPITARELVQDDAYKDVLSSYKTVFGDIDSSITLFPVDKYYYAQGFNTHPNIDQSPQSQSETPSTPTITSPPSPPLPPTHH